MRRHSACIAFSLAAAVVAVPAAAATLVFASPLSPEATGATGSGFVSVTFDTTLHQLGITTNWSGLSGVTTVAHIHCCTALAGAGNVGVATTTPTLLGFPVGVSAGTYSVLLDLTLASSYNPAFITASGGTVALAEARLLTGIQDRKSYLNIHTNLFPGGEIRGFLTAVPEPETWALLIAGFAVIGSAMRRRARHALPFAPA